jgi:hypothetical protein
MAALTGGTSRKGDHQMIDTHALDSFSAGRVTQDGTGRGCPIVTHPLDSACADVTHALRADGFDGSEDGTGRGTLQPIYT